MMPTAAEPGLEVMLRELLERQRRHDARLESLEASLTSTPPPREAAVVSKFSSDTVSMAKLKTPATIGWPQREVPAPLPALLTPVMKTKSGGVIASPPRRAAPALPPPEQQVVIRPIAPAAFPLSEPICETPEAGEDRVESQDLLLAESERRRRASDERLARLEAKLVELEEELRRSRRLETIGRLVAGVAHDFNNLLTLICGNAELVRDGLSESDPRREAADNVVSAGHSAARLSRQLLSLARPSPNEPQPLDLNDTIRDVEKMIRRLIGEGLSLTVHLAPSLEFVQADSAQVEQVLFNLAANARDAIGCGSGSIVIRTADAIIEPNRPGWPANLPTGSYVALTVSDTGCGMSDDVKARLFEPFFTTKPGGKGNGLGLANVRDTMRAAGGHVEVESAVGWGTSIRLYWPRIIVPAMRPRENAAVVPIRSQILGRGETVLLVEDDRAVRDLASVSLQQAGYRVLEAADTETAEDRARQCAGSISLLITDVGLPGRDGVQLASRLRRMKPGLRVMYVSGYGPPDPLPANAEGEFLPKPYTPQQFLDAVRQIIGQDRQD